MLNYVIVVCASSQLLSRIIKIGTLAMIPKVSIEVSLCLLTNDGLINVSLLSFLITEKLKAKAEEEEAEYKRSSRSSFEKAKDAIQKRVSETIKKLSSPGSPKNKEKDA